MVFFTHGYFLCKDEKEQQIMKPYVPLGILYLAAYLAENKVENEVFDTTFSTPEALHQRLVAVKPRYLAIYVNLMTKVSVLETIQFVKNTPDLNNTYIILGGPEVKNHADNFLAHHADCLILGEGEETMLALVQALEARKKEENLCEILDTIQGIAYKNKAGATIFTPERAKIKDIDILPFPAREKVNLHLYLDAWKKKHGQNAISVSTMRGCPYTCKWCSRAVYGLSYRRRSPKKVVEELEWIQEKYQPDTLWFVDDVFTISHKWLKEFAAEMTEKQLHIPFECITRADRLNEEVIRLLKQTGCFRVWIGAESGSQKVIDLMDRRVSVQQVREMIQLAQANGIQAGTFIMLGYPGETEEDIEETIHHLKTANPDWFTITVAYPIKGTELYTEIETHIDALPDWANSTDRDIEFKRTYSRKYYDYAVRRVVNEVNFYKENQKNGVTLRAMKLKVRSFAAKALMWWER